MPRGIDAAHGHEEPANLSVFAYSDDQAWLRLTDLLPRFQQPKAVVMLVSPGLMFRDRDQERPHLDSALDWRPAEPGSRLAALARLFLPYHGIGAIDRTQRTVRAELTEAVRRVRARGAEPLILVPRFGPGRSRRQRLGGGAHAGFGGEVEAPRLRRSGPPAAELNRRRSGPTYVSASIQLRGTTQIASSRRPRSTALKGRSRNSCAPAFWAARMDSTVASSQIITTAERRLAKGLRLSFWTRAKPSKSRPTCSTKISLGWSASMWRQASAVVPAHSTSGTGPSPRNISAKLAATPR